MAPTTHGRAHSRRDAWWVLLIGLMARLAVVAWAWNRFPPVGDATFYHQLAARIAEGQGYTWLWPDGAVTHAAHYPVGYPAAVGALYAMLGRFPEVAMLLNATLGAAAGLAVHGMLARVGRRVALAGGLIVALHPGLVAYTPALMTEGVVAAMVASAGWCVCIARRRPHAWWPVIATGVVLGLATLVRPQCILLGPALGILSRGRCWRRALGSGFVVFLVALACCAPWTARNCARMGQCALVSANGGWNLLIGTQSRGQGGWSALEVPSSCRAVFDEAEKDMCFGEAAWQRMREDPAAWLSLVPAKLGVTFDYCGAAGWYLHEANSSAFDSTAKVALGAVETVHERLLLMLALAGALPPSQLRATGRRVSKRHVALALAGLGWAFALTRYGYVAHLALAALLLLSGRALLRRPPVYGATLAVLAMVMGVHAVFFGAGRYQVVVLPMVALLAALGAARLSRWARRSWCACTRASPQVHQEPQPERH